MHTINRKPILSYCILKYISWNLKPWSICISIGGKRKMLLTGCTPLFQWLRQSELRSTTHLQESQYSVDAHFIMNLNLRTCKTCLGTPLIWKQSLKKNQYDFALWLLDSRFLCTVLILLLISCPPVAWRKASPTTRTPNTTISWESAPDPNKGHLGILQGPTSEVWTTN